MRASAGILPDSTGEEGSIPQTGKNPSPLPGAEAPLDALRILERENEDLREEVAFLKRERAQLEDLTAMAAHELLKPLLMSECSIAAVLENSSSRLDIASQQDLERIVRASGRVRLMIEALLTDMRSSEAPLRRQHVDMAEVVATCVELLRADLSARKVRVAVAPMPVVAGNRALLNGAMGNLIANAVKYGPTDGGEIQISARRSGTGWRFDIESSGRPIPARDRLRIFEPWERGKVARRERGNGLGLAIVRRIVERHGGEVGVIALRGRGNRFYFTLPS
jgi:signal transduction histidine kinase